jgi:hypothetical protein
MAEESDKTHRLLFGFATMVEQLLRRRLPKPLIEKLDFSTLEPASERQLTEKGEVRRDGDLFWRLKYHPNEDEPFWITINLEHSSTRSRWASLTMGVYEMMDLQKQSRSKPRKHGAKLSPVISVLAYTGDALWKRVKPLHELVEQLEEPDVEEVYFLDVQREPVAAVTTPLEGFLKLHQVESFEEVGEIVRDLKPLLAEDEKLARAFLGFINGDVLRKMAKKGKKTVRLRSLEDTTMLAQRIERIRDGYIDQGKREGKRCWRASVSSSSSSTPSRTAAAFQRPSANARPRQGASNWRPGPNDSSPSTAPKTSSPRTDAGGEERPRTLNAVKHIFLLDAIDRQYQ